MTVEHNHGRHRHQKPSSQGPFYLHGLTLIPAWISYHIPGKVWNDITNLFPNFNGATVEVREYISNFIPHFVIDKINYPCCD